MKQIGDWATTYENSQEMCPVLEENTVPKSTKRNMEKTKWVSK